jgi:DNA helicase-2/ATP-dependent DNA helicase PcrA
MRGQFLRTTPSQFLYEIGLAEQENRYDTEFAQTHYDDDAPAYQKRDAEFVSGQLVNHKKFGLGRVKEYMDLGESSIVVVKFNTGKTKSLMVAYANLTKMG